MPQMIIYIDTPEEYDIDDPYPEGHLIPEQAKCLTVWMEYIELGRCRGIMRSEEDATFEYVCNIITSGLYEKGLETGKSIAYKFASFVTSHYPMYIDFPIDEILVDEDSPFHDEIWMVYVNLLETIAHGHHLYGDKRTQ